MPHTSMTEFHQQTQLETLKLFDSDSEDFSWYEEWEECLIEAVAENDDRETSSTENKKR